MIRVANGDGSLPTLLSINQMKRNYSKSIVILSALIAASILSACTASGPANNVAVNRAATPKAQATIPPNAPVGAQPPNLSGSAAATVSVEEFADFQCPTCALVHPVMNEIKSTYGSRIRFVFRNFPLQMHDKAYDAAVAAEAAGLQGKFWDMQNQLFVNQKNWTNNTNYKQLFKEYAGKIGLDVAKWETDILGLPAKNRVDADLARGKAIGINATPSLYVNGSTIEFKDMNVQTIKSVIDAELQKAAPATSTAPVANSNSNAAPAANSNQNK